MEGRKQGHVVVLVHRRVTIELPSWDPVMNQWFLITQMPSYDY